MRFQGNLLYVRDLEASVRFYEEGLGLKVVARPAPHMAIVRLGDAVVFPHSDPGDAPEWLREALNRKVRGIGVLPHIEVASVEGVKRGLEKHGYEISLGPVEEHGAMRLYVYDPSGYNLVFVEPLGGTA